VIGIMPPARDLPGVASDLYQPHTAFPDWERRRAVRAAGEWQVIARLRPSFTMEQAHAELTALSQALDAALPAPDRSNGVVMTPLHRHLVGPRQRLAIWILAAAAGCVLLIAIANVAGLSLARALARVDELATRAAIGASLARVMRLLMVESALLALASGAAGLIGAALAIPAVRRVSAELAWRGDPRITAAEWGWAFAAALVAAMIVALAPATAVARHSLRRLTASRRDASAHALTRRVRRLLVTGEVALAVVLLVSAGLLVRSWMLLQGTDAGFSPDGILSLNVSTSALPEAQRGAFYEDVLRSVSSLPNVRAAAFIGDFFISGDVEVAVTTEAATGSATIPRVRLRADEISANFFDTVSAPAVRGRAFTSADRAAGPPVAIVNESLARILWPGGEPVGARFKLGAADSDRPWVEVVGVAPDMRRQRADVAAMPQLFWPLSQQPSRNEVLLVRTGSGDPLRLQSSVQAAIGAIDRRAAVYGIAALGQQIAARQQEREVQTQMVTLFSVAALLLAAVGLYGLLHYSVTAMAHELAVRMALGATARDVRRVVIGEGVRVILAGIGIGLFGAVWLRDLLAALLFGVGAFDPVTLVAVCGALCAVAAAACYGPARRAVRVEPAAALR
jgi:predicted permease